MMQNIIFKYSMDTIQVLQAQFALRQDQESPALWSLNTQTLPFLMKASMLFIT